MDEKRMGLLWIATMTTTCRGCRAIVRWAKTSANGKQILVEQDAKVGDDGTISTTLVHWANCPVAHRFKRGASR